MVTWLTWNFSRSFRHSNTVLTLKSPSLEAVTLMASLAVRSETREICLRTALKGRLRALPVTKRLFKDPMVFLSRCARFTALGKNEPLYSRERRGRGEPSRLVPQSFQRASQATLPPSAELSASDGVPGVGQLY